MKKLLALILSLVLVLSVFCACTPAEDNEKNDPDTKGEIANDPAGDDDSSEKDDPADDDTAATTAKSFPEKMTLEKLADLKDHSYDIVSIKDGGISYSFLGLGLNDGLLSFDLKKDTEAKYTTILSMDKLFMVSEVESDAIDTVEKMNCYYLIDGEGNVLIEENYADIRIRNGRFAQVFEAVEIVDESSDYILVYDHKYYEFLPDENERVYVGGKWYVYDLLTGDKVPDATGSSYYIVGALGDLIEFKDDNGEYHVLDAKGNEITGYDDMFEDGSYLIEGDDSSTMYSSDGKKLFTFTDDDYSYISSFDGKYYEASIYGADGTTRLLVGKDGKAVTAQFDQPFHRRGNILVDIDDNILDFSGKALIEGTFDDVYVDDAHTDAVLLVNDEEFVVLDCDGSVILREEKTEDVEIDWINFIFSKEIDGETYLYCLKDKDYTVKGRGLSGGWLAVTANEDGNTYNLVDLITGETLLEGYESIESTYNVTHILAEKTETEFEVYKVN